MKTITLLSLLLCISIIVKSQNSNVFVSNDSVFYSGKCYVKGDTLTLKYGSNCDRSFSFVYRGAVLWGSDTLSKYYYKTKAVIDKVIVDGRAVYLRAKAVGAEQSFYKLFVNVEAAFDNHEIE